MVHYEIVSGDSPLVYAAIHDGHHISKDLLPYLNLSAHERRIEEDPYTGYLTDIFMNRIIVHTSRFEVDLNRLRNMAIYKTPAEAWGLNVWNKPLPQHLIQKSLHLYDTFYEEVRALLHRLINKFGFFIVLDLHTYNFRRQTDVPEASPEMNPEVNLGTESVPSDWRYIIAHFRESFEHSRINGHFPDVRENVRFKGGAFSKWVNNNFQKGGCAIAIEFKKTFMDEWTGVVNIKHLNEIKSALSFTGRRLEKMMLLNQLLQSK